MTENQRAYVIKHLYPVLREAIMQFAIEAQRSTDFENFINKFGKQDLPPASSQQPRSSSFGNNYTLNAARSYATNNAPVVAPSSDLAASSEMLLNSRFNKALFQNYSFKAVNNRQR